jgi:CheY-like chemotaxis protein
VAIRAGAAACARRFCAGLRAARRVHCGGGMNLRPPRKLNVLLVIDNEVAARAMTKQLSARCEVRTASNLREAIDELVRRVPDTIVTKLELPPYRGDVLLSMVAREHPGVRRILFVDLETAENCLDVAHVTLPSGAGPAELAAMIEEE